VDARFARPDRASACATPKETTVREMPSDIEIARAATLKPIAQVAEKLGIPDDALHNYGKHIAKLDHGFIGGLEGKP